jgi:hypothetical protein
VPVGLLDDVAYGAPGPVATELAGVLTAIYSGVHRLSDRWLTLLEA